MHITSRTLTERHRHWAAWLPTLLLTLATATQAKAPAGRFAIKTDVSGDVVADATFKCTWQRTAAPNPYNWAGAKTYCQNLQVQGTGWRLPTRRELESLVDFKTSSPAIDKTYFPGTVSDYYWSSTPNQPSASGAWVVGFGSGNSIYFDFTSNFRVRCVR